MEIVKGIQRLRYAIILFVGMMTVGVLGYFVIEGMDFLDSLYMTVITVATVGFGEVHELSTGGKIFTITLIIISMGVLAYSVSAISAILFEGELANYYKGQRVMTEISKMKNHTILCGFGLNARQAAAELVAHDQSFVIIENDHTVIEAYKENKDYFFVEGDATEDEVLIKAGIESCRALITTLPTDSGNLFVVITARSLNPEIIIVSRASHNSSCNKLIVAGVDNVVMPERVGGAHMATLIVKPDVVEFLERISVQDNMTNLEEIVCSTLPEEYRNKSIHDLDIRRKSGANIIGFKTPEGKYIINPGADIVMIPHAKLFVLGTPEQINIMKEIFSSNIGTSCAR